MYKIEKRPSGYLLTFSGTIDATEMQRWQIESKTKLALETSKSFGVIIDMRDLQPLSKDASKIMIEGQKPYKQTGMKKSAVILNNAEICTQFKNLALQSGIFTTEKYIDGSKHGQKAIEMAINWVKGRSICIFVFF